MRQRNENGTFSVWTPKGSIKTYKSEFDYLLKTRPDLYLFRNSVLEISNEVRNEANTIQEFFDKMEERLILKNLQNKVLLLKPSQVKFGLLSTTHSHPIGQKSTGWSLIHIEEIGWKGRIRLVNGIGKDIFDYNIFHDCCINSGTGGGGGFAKDIPNGISYEYDMSVFIKDIPKVYIKFLEFFDENNIFIQNLIKMYESQDRADRKLATSISENSDIVEEIHNILSYDGVTIINNGGGDFIPSLYEIYKKYMDQPIKFETHKRIPTINEWNLEVKKLKVNG